MHAIVRVNTFDLGMLRAHSAGVEAFNQRHASQPGYVGTLSVELGSGRRLVVNLWQDEAAATAALSALGPEVAKVLEPLMTAPSQLIGAGAVETDLPWT